MHAPKILSLTCRILVMLALCLPGLAYAQYTVFLDNFDDGDWTSHPPWEPDPVAGSITVSDLRSTSGDYSLRVASTNEQGAIRAVSCLSSASQPYSCTFNLYVESMGDEAIPWSLQNSTGSVAAIVFILPGGRVELFALNSTTGWQGITSVVPYSLTYGQWHSFRLTYDGMTTNLYLDGHETPDASVTQTYVYLPARICIGNFSLPHTSVFHIDDLRIETDVQPAKVYVQVCSDTSTNGISVTSHYMNFPEDDYSYTSPTGQAAQVMAESYRNAHRDSLGNPIKFTWYMLVGSLYGYGTDTGPLLPLELMLDNHGDSIALWGDEMAYHYHTWVWSDLNDDGVYYWNQAPDFSWCVDDFDATLAHMVLDRGIYPCSFRSGWHGMDDYFQRYLDDWIPYRFENSYPSYRTETTEPVDNVFDWSRSPSVWVPYHPDPDDYQSLGSLRGWESRCGYIPGITADVVEDIFLHALAGTPQVVTAWSHLKEADFPDQVSALHSRLTAMHDTLPMVEFEYLTGRECMLKWRNGSDTIPPIVETSFSDESGIRTVTITCDEPIYQQQPFVAWRGADGAYRRLNASPAGPNAWQVQYSPLDTFKAAVGVTDWFGNAVVQVLPVPLKIGEVRSSTGSTTAEISWDTNLPADTRLEYHLVSSGGTTSVYESALVTAHRVLLSNLLPASIYRVTASSEDESGHRVQSQDIYVLTTPGNPVIVDNVDPGFSVSGAWSTGSTAPGHYGDDYRYATTSPTGTSHADWTCQATEAGVYRICAWWSEGTNRSSSARYSVFYRGSEYPVTVNQQTDGGQWNTLGIYVLEQGETVSVRLYNTAPSGYVVIADAVRIEAPYAQLSTIGFLHVLPPGSSVEVSNVAVTAVFDSCSYVEEQDRSSAIRVTGTGVSPGDLVNVYGTISVVDGERAIADCTIVRLDGHVDVEPLGMCGRDVNLESTAVLTTSGLLVTVWGRVCSVGTGYFVIDDGSTAEGAGVRIDASLLPDPPSEGDRAIITGVVGAAVVDGKVVPMIRPRSIGDFRFINL